MELRFDPLFGLRLRLHEVLGSKQTRPPLINHAPGPALPGALVRALILAEFGKKGPLSEIYAQPHRVKGVIGDPFMGTGTVLTEANRLGFHTMGCCADPMACWMTRQALVGLDIEAFDSSVAQVIADTESVTAPLYQTQCGTCGGAAQAAYFLWIARGVCSHCGERNDLCPDPKIAQAGRYPSHIYACLSCGILNSFDAMPSQGQPLSCGACEQPINGKGNVSRGQVRCGACNKDFPLPEFAAVPKCRLLAVAVHCRHCSGESGSVSFKTPDAEDSQRAYDADDLLSAHASGLPLPEQKLWRTPQTAPLFRGGYSTVGDLSNPRQALTLGLLLKAIVNLPEKECTYALLTAFSEILRFQNMLCRHNARTLKCNAPAPDKELWPRLIFRENHVLGIDSKFKGSFRQAVQAYRRAKIYSASPFELIENAVKPASAKSSAIEIQRVPVPGEQITTTLVKRWPYVKNNVQPARGRKQTLLIAGAANKALPPDAVLHGVFTRVPRPGRAFSWDILSQAWLDKPLGEDFSMFRGISEDPSGLSALPPRGVANIEQSSESISAAFKNFSGVLAPAAPFVFAYAHEEWMGFVPIAVAVLEARLFCTAVFLGAERKAPKKYKDPNECGAACMIFVCRARLGQEGEIHDAFIPGQYLNNYIRQEFMAHRSISQKAGFPLSNGDRKSIVWALLTQWTVHSLFRSYSEIACKPFAERVQRVRRRMEQGCQSISFEGMLE